ncbi:hypothetical protein HK104_004834, partial [Borealophlyctis nickersoniae]
MAVSLQQLPRRNVGSSSGLELSGGKAGSGLGRALRDGGGKDRARVGQREATQIDFQHIKSSSPITYLYISNNQLAQLPDELQLFTELTHLDVSFNHLRRLPHVHRSLDRLMVLDARSNQITALPKELAACSNLRKLLLFKNDLEELSGDTFATLADLRVLDVSCNRLVSLPTGLFESCRALRELLLGDNLIQQLPESVGALTNLTRLDLSNNKLESLPLDIGKLTRLVELDVSQNQLRHIADQTFASLIELKELYLHNNKLERLPDFAPLVNLQVLNLHRNPFTIVPLSIVKLTCLDTLTVDVHDASTITMPPLQVCQRGLDAIVAYLKDLLAGAPEASYCEATGPGVQPQGTVSASMAFTIRSFDKYGHRKTSGGDVFSVEVASVRSNGNVGQSCQIGVVRDLGDGTYDVTYDGSKTGMYQVVVKTCDQHVRGSPFRVELKSGPVCQSKCTCTGIGLTRSEAGRAGTFIIQPRDEFGNVTGVDGSMFNITMALAEGTGTGGGGVGNASDRIKWSVTDNGDGTFLASYLTTVSGAYSMDVSLNGQPINGSPFHVDIDPVETYATACTASLTGLGNVEVGVRTSFVIQAKDRYGNPRTKGGDIFTAMLFGPDGQTVTSEVVDNQNGEYFVTYVAPQPGRYRVEVKLVEPKGTGRNIAGAPFLLHVQDVKDAILLKHQAENVKLANDLADLHKKYQDLLTKTQHQSTPQMNPYDSEEEDAPKEYGIRGSTSFSSSRNPSNVSLRDPSIRPDPLPLLFRYDPQDESAMIGSLLHLRAQIQPLPFHILALCVLQLAREDKGERVAGLVANAVGAVRRLLFTEDVDNNAMVFWLANAIHLHSVLGNYGVALGEKETCLLLDFVNDTYSTFIKGTQNQVSPLI